MTSTILQKLEMIQVTELSFETLLSVSEFLKAVPDLHKIRSEDIQKLHAIGIELSKMVPNMKNCFDILGSESVSRSEV